MTELLDGPEEKEGDERDDERYDGFLLAMKVTQGVMPLTWGVASTKAGEDEFLAPGRNTCATVRDICYFDIEERTFQAIDKERPCKNANAQTSLMKTALLGQLNTVGANTATAQTDMMQALNAPGGGRICCKSRKLFKGEWGPFEYSKQLPKFCKAGKKRVENFPGVCPLDECEPGCDDGLEREVTHQLERDEGSRVYTELIKRKKLVLIEVEQDDCES